MYTHESDDHRSPAQRALDQSAYQQWLARSYAPPVLVHPTVLHRLGYELSAYAALAAQPRNLPLGAWRLWLRYTAQVTSTRRLLAWYHDPAERWRVDGADLAEALGSLRQRRRLYQQTQQ